MPGARLSCRQIPGSAAARHPIPGSGHLARSSSRERAALNVAATLCSLSIKPYVSVAAQRALIIKADIRIRVKVVAGLIRRIGLIGQIKPATRR